MEEDGIGKLREKKRKEWRRQIKWEEKQADLNQNENSHTIRR